MRILLAILLGMFPLHADLPRQPTKVQPSSVPSPPFMVAGGFVVPIGDTLLAAGGKDGRFLIWKTSLKGGGRWEPTEIAMPENAAHAAWGSSWIVAGGAIDGKPVGTVSVLELAGGLPVLHPLPDLPVGVVGAAAAVLSDKLYVLGGLKTPGDSSPGSELWILDLKSPKVWQPGPTFPGEPRAFPAITEQYGMLCLFGGSGEGSQPLADAWVFRPTPLEGTKDSGWKRVSDIPVPSLKTVALPIGQAQVLLFSETPGKTVAPFLYHTLTDAWCGLDALDGLTDPIAVPTGEKTFLLAQSADGAKAFDFQVLRNVRTLNWLDYTVILGYFGIISTIGILASRHQKSSADFSLGGRNVPWWVAGISMFATGASAISFMAVPALAFQTNLIFLFPILVMIPAY